MGGCCRNRWADIPEYAQYDRAEQAIDARKQRLHDTGKQIDQLIDRNKSEISSDTADFGDDFSERALVAALFTEYEGLVSGIDETLRGLRSRIDQALEERDNSNWSQWNTQLEVYGICQTSCPLISCGVSDFRGAVFVFGVEPDWSSRLPVSGFA